MNNNLEIEQLEIEVNSNPNSINSLCRLAELYFSDGRVNKASPLVYRAIEQFLKTQLTVTQGVNVFETSLRLWRTERFANKKLMRVNVSKERKQLLESIHQIILALLAMRDPKQGNIIAFKSAFIKECIGSLQDSLSLLSDLIAIQAVEGVDFNYVIFKAAVLLKNFGQNKQSIEYLEYLEEDPPSESGYTKTHVLAFLILVYEQSADKYKVFLSSTYRKLLQACQEDVEKNKSKQNKKLLEIISNKSVMLSSELWEVLAIQAMDRCEYILAMEFLQQALLKSPGKGLILHWLVEVSYLVGDLPKASKYGEKATIVLPQSTELRNLLIQIDPDKWTEKLRFISPTKVAVNEDLNNALSSNVNGPPMSRESMARSPSRKTRLGELNVLSSDNLGEEGEMGMVTGKSGKGKSFRAHSPSKVPTPSSALSPNNPQQQRPSSSDSAVNWFSKITNSAASAIVNLTKEVRSPSPGKGRRIPSLFERKREENVIKEEPGGEDQENEKDKREGEEQQQQQDLEGGGGGGGVSFKNVDIMNKESEGNFDEMLGFVPPGSPLSQKIQTRDSFSSPQSRSEKRKGSAKMKSGAASGKHSPSVSAKPQKYHPVEASLAIEETIESFNQPFPSKLSKKPPPLDEEARKYLKLAMEGNANIHFYHPGLQELSKIPKKIEIQKRREELLK